MEKKMLPRYPGWFSATFLEHLFFRLDPQVVAKGDLLGFWPVLGRGRLEKFRARVKNGKTQFPGARGTFGGKIRPPQKFLPEIAQLFCSLCFDRTAPQGREIAKYGGFRHFWPSAALGTWRNSGANKDKHKQPY